MENTPTRENHDKVVNGAQKMGLQNTLICVLHVQSSPFCCVLYIAKYHTNSVKITLLIRVRVSLGLWDSHPEGRVGKIIDRSVRSQHRFLLSFFHDFNPLGCILRETEVQHPASDSLAILLTRYMDNNYVALLDVPHQLHDVVRFFLCRFQSTIYDIPMKWEPEGDIVSWCEAPLTTSGMLVLKGVPTGPDKSAWQLWHRCPSCPVTLQSMIPSVPSPQSCHPLL